MITGEHLIAGNWVKGGEAFQSTPYSGTAHSFTNGTPQMVADAVEAAEAAFWSYSSLSLKDRAAFLNKIADEIDARGDELTAIGVAETGLPEGRLNGERGRTVGQIRMFADMIASGRHLDKQHDAALPDRAPLPRPDLKMIQRPLGPVAVFGASNFPLAFSTAGGDTAAALAAGCPVVVKGHPAHPGTAEIVAQAIHAAIDACKVHPGTFSLIQSNGIDVGTALVKHPMICAVGFTGSLRAGRALFDLCAARPVPIPFYGELGAINPVFLMPGAVAKRGTAIAEGWAGSLTMGAGQFCTNPGVAIAINSAETETFATTAAKALSAAQAQPMLTDGIANAFRAGADTVAAQADPLVQVAADGRNAAAHLYRVSGAQWHAQPDLAHEVFGPLGILVTVDTMEEMADIARGLDGQLTATLQIEPEDHETASCLVPVLERKAGRVLANGFPTGVEVADAMVHGGPYPASTNFGHSAVGSSAIKRFLRPVCYQGMPDALLPGDWSA